MSKFTPGPWEVSNCSHGHTPRFIQTADGSRALAMAYTLSRDDTDPVDDNARLIAAAPKLYGLLNDFVKKNQDNDNPDNLFYEAAKLVIIAKAFLDEINGGE